MSFWAQVILLNLGLENACFHSFILIDTRLILASHFPLFDMNENLNCLSDLIERRKLVLVLHHRTEKKLAIDATKLLALIFF